MQRSCPREHGSRSRYSGSGTRNSRRCIHRLRLLSLPHQLKNGACCCSSPKPPAWPHDAQQCEQQQSHPADKPKSVGNHEQETNIGEGDRPPQKLTHNTVQHRSRVASESDTHWPLRKTPDCMKTLPSKKYLPWAKATCGRKARKGRRPKREGQPEREPPPEMLIRHVEVATAMGPKEGRE